MLLTTRRLKSGRASDHKYYYAIISSQMAAPSHPSQAGHIPGTNLKAIFFSLLYISTYRKNLFDLWNHVSKVFVRCICHFNYVKIDFRHIVMAAINGHVLHGFETFGLLVYCICLTSNSWGSFHDSSVHKLNCFVFVLSCHQYYSNNWPF